MDSIGLVEAIRVVNKATQLKEKSDIHNTSSSHLNMLQCQHRQLFPGRTVYVNYGGLRYKQGRITLMWVEDQNKDLRKLTNLQHKYMKIIELA
jgi:hypothetical protein